MDAGESDLKRAARERLERNKPNRDRRTGGIVLRSPGDNYEVYKERQPDASESPWLYLFFILILVAEQAMAVHLSFHLKNEAGSTAPAGDTKPLVFAHSYSVLDNGSLSVPASGVLANDVSANGQALTAVLA